MRATDCPILYVDDESPNIVVFESTFGEEFEIVCVSSGEEALGLLDRLPIGVLLADQRMPGMSGIDLCERVREWHPEVVRILVTAYSDQATAIDAINRGGLHRYLTKPWDAWEVRQILAEAVTRVKLQRTVAALRATIEQREREGARAFLRARVLYDLANVTNTLLATSTNLEGHLREVEPSLPAPVRAPLAQDLGELQRALAYLVSLHEKTRSVLTRPRPERHGLAAIVADAVALVRPELPRGADVDVDVPDDLDVYADRTDVLRVLVNLLQNARRAIETGGASPGRIRVDGVREGGRVRLRVADSGDGLDPALREQVFHLDTNLPSRTMGSGLGLPICRELARANEGELGIAAEGPLTGACFFLLLPSSATEAHDGRTDPGG